MKEWLVAMYNQNPTIFLKEARQKFMLAFGLSISTSHISVILREAGMTWKCLERRAIQVCYQDVIRFTNELLLVPWLGCNLVFLDEVSFDNRNMLRNKGFGLKGQRLYFRGEYARKPRVSLMAFIGINGLIDTFKVEGTFDRILFATCCKEFATGGFVSQYPGQHSVWILDGASIHRDENITYFLRSLGIIVIFLPAYCPFFNPIEIMFGLVKQKMKKYYETSGLDFETMIIDVISSFQNTDFTGIFRKCGYSNNCFDPAVGLGQSLQDFDFDLGPEEQ
ncbi:hypothetical protein MP638_001421 [Amoeboaphelidium occidentale]|nr:hypothetical protein MP638_001421 [Amoeboaphelidium occidentale]